MDRIIPSTITVARMSNAVNWLEFDHVLVA